MFLNRKKFFASLLIFISLGGISWFVFYEYSVRSLEKALKKIELNLNNKGYTVSYSKVQILGSPLYLKVIFENPHLKDPKGLIEWEGSQVEIQVRPWQFHTLTCDFIGDHKVTIPQTTPVPLGVLQFKEAQGTFIISPEGTLAEASLIVGRISSLVESQLQPVFFKEVVLNIQNVNDPSNLMLSLKTQILDIEKVLDIPPFDHPFTLEFQGKLSGYQSKNSFPTTLAEWRDGGGVLEVMKLKIFWPPLIAEAEGTITLDSNMYPLGSFSSKVVAYQDALEDMVKLGWIKKKKAKVASFMLELFSVPDETYGRKLTVPITLQNETLSVGPAPLIKLRPLIDF